MDPNAAGPGYAGLLMSFLAIVAMIPLTLWLIKRSSLQAVLNRRLGTSPGGAADSTEVQVLIQAALGPGQRVVVVKVRHGGTVQTLVLGTTAQQVSHLSTLPGSVLRETA